MSNGNTSATGGYLVEVETPPLNDQELLRFLHGVIVGVTCIINELVRPGWDVNPQVRPKIDVDWVSFSIVEQRPDNDPYQKQRDDGTVDFSRHEEFDVQCSFYGPNAQSFSGILRDGLYLSQNRDQLSLVNMGVVGFSETIHIPELINDSRYFNRYDMTMTLRREIIRVYPILNFLGVDGVISANAGEKTIVETFST